MIDFTVEGSGSIYILTPQNNSATEWIDEHVSEDRISWGKGIVVENRYIEPLVTGILRDGFRVAWEGEEISL